MENVKITQVKADWCGVCEEMEPEIKALRKICSKSKGCEVRIVDENDFEVPDNMKDEDGDPMFPGIIIEKNGKSREFVGFMKKEDILKIAEDM